jgi:hypothetical protein
MKFIKVIQTPEPIPHRFTLQSANFTTPDAGIGGIRPIPEVFDKAMSLRILVDVHDQTQEIIMRRYRDAPKWPLEQGSRAMVSPIERLGVSIEQVGERLAGFFEAA